MILGKTFYHWKSLKLSEPDAVSFFHRITTQDVLNAHVNALIPFCLTERTGFLISHGFFQKNEATELNVYVENLFEEGLDAHLKRYKVIEKVMWNEPKPIHVTALWDTSGNYPEVPVELLAVPFREGSPVAYCFHEVNWNAQFYKEASENEYDSIRCQWGIPSLGAELIEKKLPLELGLGHCVSQTKGCYPGQETLTKFSHRGGNPRQLCSLRFDAPEALRQKGAWNQSELSLCIQLPDGATDSPGTITSIALSGKHLDVLAILRRALAEDPKQKISLQFGSIQVPCQKLAWFP